MIIERTILVCQSADEKFLLEKIEYYYNTKTVVESSVPWRYKTSARLRKRTSRWKLNRSGIPGIHAFERYSAQFWTLRLPKPSPFSYSGQDDYIIYIKIFSRSFYNYNRTFRFRLNHWFSIYEVTTSAVFLISFGLNGLSGPVSFGANRSCFVFSKPKLQKCILFRWTKKNGGPV